MKDLLKRCRAMLLPGLIVGMVVAGNTPFRAQSPPARAAYGGQQASQADIDRLQNSVFALSGEVMSLRDRNPDLARELQYQLDGIREDVIYLKVKLRRFQQGRENAPSTADVSEVEARLNDVRGRMHGGPAATAGRRGEDSMAPPGSEPAPPASESAPRPQPASPRATATRSGGEVIVPVGTELDVRLQQTLSSGTSNVEDRFEATTVVPLMVEGVDAIPAGTLFRGVVSGVHKATRTERTGSLTLTFNQMTLRGRVVPIRATVTQVLESEGIAGEKEKIGIGAGAGAILGGILGGFKGALAGILIGGGGTVAATKGEDVTVPAGTILRVRLDQPVSVRAETAR